MTRDLFVDPPPSDTPSIADQILAVELWVRGLKDWVERHGASRRRPEEEIARKRQQLVGATAVVATLRAVETRTGGTP